MERITIYFKYITENILLQVFLTTITLIPSVFLIAAFGLIGPFGLLLNNQVCTTASYFLMPGFFVCFISGFILLVTIFAFIYFTVVLIMGCVDHIKENVIIPAEGELKNIVIN